MAELRRTASPFAKCAFSVRSASSRSPAAQRDAVFAWIVPGFVTTPGRVLSRMDSTCPNSFVLISLSLKTRSHMFRLLFTMFPMRGCAPDTSAS